MPMAYLDRRDAGKALAAALESLRGTPRLQVLALPRGGVPVAYEVARALDAPLDVLVVRKLGLPWQPELAMGAVTSGGLRVLNEEIVRRADVSPADLERVVQTELAELARREREYRGARPFPDLAGRVVVLVDDGLATGASMEAAVGAVRAASPARVIVAVPVAPAEVVEHMSHVADDCICPYTPEPFEGVGQWYQDFSQTTDEEVMELLDAASSARARG